MEYQLKNMLVSKRMKKVIAHLLLWSIISGTFHLDELIRLPFLIGHYSEHKLLHPGDSVSEFLYKHYILNQKAESEKDKKSDSQMPFKSPQSFGSHLSQFAFDEKQSVQPTNQNSATFFSPYTNVYDGCIFFSIWQPPKVS